MAPYATPDGLAEALRACRDNGWMVSIGTHWRPHDQQFVAFFTAPGRRPRIAAADDPLSALRAVMATAAATDEEEGR